MKDPMHLISLGAGVQSSTMALMAAHEQRTLPNYDLFFHRSRVPLDQADFGTDIDHGQQELNLFRNECEGMCGV
jgi:hypothetical protein